MKWMQAIDEERPLLVTLSSSTAQEEERPRRGPVGYQTTATDTTAILNSDGDKDVSLEKPGQQPQSSNGAGAAAGGGVVVAVVTQGHLLLLLVAVLYGTLNVCLRGIYALDNPPSASALSTVRGWLAVVCFVPFLYRHHHRRSFNNQYADTPNEQHQGPKHVYKTADFIKVALELAVWNFGAQGLANVGLLYIASARAAFLTQLSVVITPLLSAILGTRVHANVWWACPLALAGLILLSQCHGNDDNHNNDSNGSAAASTGLGFGDFLCLGGALSWSTYLYRMSAVGDLYPEVPLQAWKNMFLAMLYTCWCMGAYLVSDGTTSLWMGWHDSWLAWILLAYSAAGPGTVADVWQQMAQANVSATVANIVLSLEPVFTALFGRILLGEETSGMEKLGGLCILTAAVVATRE